MTAFINRIATALDTQIRYHRTLRELQAMSVTVAADLGITPDRYEEIARRSALHR